MPPGFGIARYSDFAGSRGGFASVRTGDFSDQRCRQTEQRYACRLRAQYAPELPRPGTLVDSLLERLQPPVLADPRSGLRLLIVGVGSRYMADNIG